MCIDRECVQTKQLEAKDLPPPLPNPKVSKHISNKSVKKQEVSSGSLETLRKLIAMGHEVQWATSLQPLSSSAERSHRNPHTSFKEVTST
eukprot:1051548-Amphidinium_carterae.1